MSGQQEIHHKTNGLEYKALLEGAESLSGVPDFLVRLEELVSEQIGVALEESESKVRRVLYLDNDASALRNNLGFIVRVRHNYKVKNGWGSLFQNDDPDQPITDADVLSNLQSLKAKKKGKTDIKFRDRDVANMQSNIDTIVGEAGSSRYDGKWGEDYFVEGDAVAGPLFQAAERKESKKYKLNQDAEGRNIVEKLETLEDIRSVFRLGSDALKSNEGVFAVNDVVIQEIKIEYADVEIEVEDQSPLLISPVISLWIHDGANVCAEFSYDVDTNTAIHNIEHFKAAHGLLERIRSTVDASDTIKIASGTKTSYVYEGSVANNEAGPSAVEASPASAGVFSSRSVENNLAAEASTPTQSALPSAS